MSHALDPDTWSPKLSTWRCFKRFHDISPSCLEERDGTLVVWEVASTATLHENVRRGCSCTSKVTWQHWKNHFGKHSDDCHLLYVRHFLCVDSDTWIPRKKNYGLMLEGPERLLEGYLDGGVQFFCYLHPYLIGDDPIWPNFSKWVETTN